MSDVEEHNFRCAAEPPRGDGHSHAVAVVVLTELDQGGLDTGEK